MNNEIKSLDIADSASFDARPEYIELYTWDDYAQINMEQAIELRDYLTDWIDENG